MYDKIDEIFKYKTIQCWNRKNLLELMVNMKANASVDLQFMTFI